MDQAGGYLQPPCGRTGRANGEGERLIGDVVLDDDMAWWKMRRSGLESGFGQSLAGSVIKDDPGMKEDQQRRKENGDWGIMVGWDSSSRYGSWVPIQW